MATLSREPIAIVGIGCRFPGADDPQAFWELLRAGRHAVREVPPGRWDPGECDDAASRTMCRTGGFLDDVHGFDWRSLRVSPREARTIDPQHRLLLEVAWEALEDAGLPFESVAGTRAGVFVGVTWNDHLRLLARDGSLLDGYTASGAPLAFAANRISYTFDLRGPSVAMDATCSASMMAVHQACQSLWCGESELALAGGVNLLLAAHTSIIMARAGVLSAQGRCRALDVAADGFVRGEGAGLLVLKPSSALTAADRVYALIAGICVNHNGRGPWIMAPRAESQTAVITAALAQAAVDPAQVDYVELHGTGFPQGDPIEIAALAAALGPDRSRPCAIGSVKTNIGNLEPAAGVASLIKVALALHHGELPPTLHLETENPALRLAERGLVAQTELAPWPAKAGARVAGVTTTSFSGVNAHAVLTAPSTPARVASSGGPRVLPLSARTPEALQAAVVRVAAWLRRTDAPLDDVCHTAAALRSHHAHRVAVVGATASELAAALDHWRLAADVPVSAEDPTPRGACERLARAYMAGDTLDWPVHAPAGRCVSMPTYAWQREPQRPAWQRAEAGPSHASEASRDATHGDALPGSTQLQASHPGVQRTDADPSIGSRLRAAPAGSRRALLRIHIEAAVREALELPVDVTFAPTRPLFELGLSSTTALALRGRFERELACSLPPTLLFDHPTVATLAERLTREAVPAPTQPQADPADDRAREIAELSEAEAEARLVARLERLRRPSP